MAALAFGAVGCSAGASTAAAPQVALASKATSDRAADLCAGVPGLEQERPYFLREDGIEEVRPLRERSSVARRSAEVRGAEIVLRPAPAVTRHWLARVLRCHLADPVALAVGDGLADPLVVGAPTVSLDHASDRIVLRIVGRDAALGEEILRRAEQLRGVRVARED
jgi:hypothetical protein